MKHSRRFTLLLSLLLATTVAIGVYFAVSSKEDKSITAAVAPPTPTSIPTVAVLVAKLNIPAATTLTDDLVEVRQVPIESRNARALSETSQAVGKMTAVTLSQGEQILDLRLTEAPPATGTNTFAGQVPVGMRAISVVFDEVIGSGALVQPGDHIDVLAFFELEVKDFSVQDNTDQNADSDDNNESKEDEYDYKQYVTTYVLQNVEVLAVSQAISPDDLGVDGQATVPTPTPNASATVTPGTDAGNAPVARPGAKSVTLAVTPEQAQRLLLASQTVKNEKGSLRLAMRAPGDTTTVNLRPAQLGEIPVGNLLGDVDQPMVPTELVITDATFRERIVPSGGLLEFTATVKNVSDHTIESGNDAPPEYVYTEGIAYDALGFFMEEETYRIGLNLAGAYPNQFPYRWSLGRDLEPGESIDIVGSVRLTEPDPDTRYWLGIILEPNIVTQDGMNVSSITVVQSETARVNVATAMMREASNETSGIVLELIEGDELEIVKAQGAWFQVRFGQKEGWIKAGDLVVPPLGGPADAS